MSEGMIRRHSGVGIFLHWFNTVCWFFLVATGLGLIRNDDLQPLGAWWPRMLGAIFGAPENLLLAHEICGFLWAGVFLVLGVIFARSETLPFLAQIFSFSPRSDALWLVKKMGLMTVGQGPLRKLGLDEVLPDQGFYNVGQKLFAVPAVLGGVTLVVTGAVMAFSKSFADPSPVQWAMLIHYLAFGAVFAGLLVHIFMAAVATGETPALRSMFTGHVPAEFARHHNPQWYRTVAEVDPKHPIRGKG